MHSSTTLFYIKLFTCIVSFFIFFSTTDAAQECEQPAGRLVSIQGGAQILSKGESAWDPIRQEHVFCPGDMLRTAANSRAAVVLPNEIILRINQKTTLTFPEAVQEKPLLLKVMEGVLHIFSHRPRALQVNTPFVNGAVEGTEFLVKVVPDSTVITVFSGLVTAKNNQGRLDISSGQSVVARKGTAPEYKTVVKPRDAVHWALYYPVIIVSSTDTDTQKDILSQLLHSASGQLSVGRAKEAQETINRVLKEDPANGEALALQSIIAVVQNNKEQALTLATRAVEAAPQSAAAKLALSYAQQAHFDLHGALKTLEEAALSNPDNAQVKARVSELYLSVGELDKALSAAQEAVNFDPDIGRTQTVLGFAHLTRIETEQAQKVFRKAISLDQTLPLARLGLGLAMIRNGDLEEGRAEIEIAAALDPENALIRSYLGKAYFEEKRDGRSQRQYETAKKLDPSDPTPWFYDAIRKQTVNRPVEALHDLQRSIELNDNRAVHRSRLLLDEDLASRSAGLARIYNDLGFQQLALAEGRKSVNADPADFSAHRFLADTYGSLPRHEIARVSELLQSQLLQPINISPVQPQLAESDLFILEGTGPANSSFNEYNPLFLRNRLALQASGVAGSNDTLGDEIVQSGIWNNFSYSLGQFHYQTDGFRTNNDQEQDILTAFAQARFGVNTSVLGEIRYKERKFGDLELLFDPYQYSETQRQNVTTTTYRFGVNHVFSPGSEIIGSFIAREIDEEIDDTIEIGKLNIDEETQGYLAEALHLFRTERLNVVSGLGYYDGDFNGTIKITPDIPFFPADLFQEERDVTHANAYVYSHLKATDVLKVTFGLSYDTFDNDQQDQDQFNPKVGISWDIFETTTLRLAAFRVLTRTLISDQTVEPTQVAGFNQFFDDIQGTDTWTFGGAIDHSFSDSLFGGAEFLTRSQDIPYEDFESSIISQSIVYSNTDWQEDMGRAYLYWTPCSMFSTSLEYFYERFDKGSEFFGTENIQDLTSQRFRIGGGFFHPNGIFTKIKASYITQKGDFFEPLYMDAFQDSDQFWVVDAGIGYRLPNRYGFVSLEVKNLFDQDFNYQDTDPARPEISPESLILFRLTLAL